MQLKIDYVISWVDEKKSTHTVYERKISSALKLRAELRERGYVATLEKRIIQYTAPSVTLKIVG